MSLQIAKRLLTVAEYHKMAEAGILDEDDRVELIHGEIIEMSPIGSKHSGHVKRINALFYRLLGDKVIIGVQDPVALGKYNEPEPDIAILRYRDDFYTDQHPQPQDILLVIEVSDSSIDYDREIKLPLFASAGIPEFWIVNLNESKVEVYKEPKSDTYNFREEYRMTDIIIWEPFDLPIKVNRIFG
jgi:Uma2 family endonuclease